ncbi:phage N-6-adenine-methyltransferase [Brenneria corticis]|uniref:Phage N-6-adenine-methyltransferase n=1 Tax=Brenneria corticis TaxID=2173106 RepID=A0A2U1TMA8_9GAMM|nr:phage N-6-adenine-methyltransferase [Brenneria sp. CFCC 11842]PWC10526.1 phage N-6-adenine-methyltransferase [Brenneria sp. CFCC 11842]
MNNSYVEALNALREQPAHELREVGDQWRTSEALFWGINAMFGPFVLDLFAEEDNAKCEAFYSSTDNALVQDWAERLAELNGAAFANPPYSRAKQHDGQYITGMRHIIDYTMDMRERGGRYVFLIKAATSEVWWPEQADHIAFIRGRLGFDLPTWFRPKDEKQVPTGAFFAGAIAVFDKAWRGPASGYIERDRLLVQGRAFMAQIRREAAQLARQNQLQNIPEIIPVPDTGNTVWPSEVNFLFGQIPAACTLADGLQHKLRWHINRLRMEGMLDSEAIAIATSLAEQMGATVTAEEGAAS